MDKYQYPPLHAHHSKSTAKAMHAPGTDTTAPSTAIATSNITATTTTTTTATAKISDDRADHTGMRQERVRGQGQEISVH